MWATFQFLVWAWTAVWVYPRFLAFVGGGDVAHWLERHLWFRLALWPFLGPLLLLSFFQVRKRSDGRTTPSGFEVTNQAAPVDSPGIDPTYGFPADDAVRVPVGAWAMRIGTWSRKNVRRTVARVEVDAASAFSFLARSSRREPVLLRGLQQAAMRIAMRRVAETNPGARASGAVEAVAYLGEAPVAIGDAALDRIVVLRANHPGAARALLSSGPVARAIAALEEQGWGWEWTFYPTTVPGRAEMTLELPGSMERDDRIGLARALMSGAIEHLAGTGEIRATAA